MKRCSSSSCRRPTNIASFCWPTSPLEVYFFCSSRGGQRDYFCQYTVGGVVGYHDNLLSSCRRCFRGRLDVPVSRTPIPVSFRVGLMATTGGEQQRQQRKAYQSSKFSGDTAGGWHPRYPPPLLQVFGRVWEFPIRGLRFVGFGVRPYVQAVLTGKTSRRTLCVD